MTREEFSDLIFSRLEFHPTPGQQKLASLLSEFILSGNYGRVFQLRGYAGTGKTTMIGALVSALEQMGHPYVLMAPTGRAAKVLSAYSGRKAHTIHRLIYFAIRNKEGRFLLSLMPNRHRNTLFIVDEASMIPGNSPAANGMPSVNLLDDLFTYVASGKGCRLMFVGDTAQLPPVGLNISPALDAAYLRARYSQEIITSELTEVVRQSEMSGILHNATLLRDNLLRPDLLPVTFNLSGYADVVRTSSEEFEEQLNMCFHSDDFEDAVMITRSNKRANLFNQAIRQRILGREEDISTGDRIMVVKNNYFWLDDSSEAGFIANGDLLQLRHIKFRQQVFGFDFADATFAMADYPGQDAIDARLLLDTIQSENAALSEPESNRLFNEILNEYSHEEGRGKQVAGVMTDPYFNALQVKFAYALTCHKTQGGQWKYVFIDGSYLKAAEPERESLRWLYTALTRATEKVFLVNFEENFF